MLGGVVGSHAYGLNTEASDVDRMYFAAAPTVAFHGLNPPWGKTATVVQKDPLSDVVVHEAAKMLGLVLKCNPSVLEVLWLDEYEVRTNLGARLIDLRGKFISQRLVRNAYLGYATDQFTRLTNAGRFSSVPVNRIKKHARHILRLLDQGTQLYTTGTFTVKVDEPQRYFDFAEEVAENPDAAQRELSRAEDVFDITATPLPVEPNLFQAEVWLHSVRALYY
jgi:predicted nucleotidyltransferase